jgi:type I restriction enzyme R subunit
MSFNKMNTTENALRDHLVDKQVTMQTGIVAEEITEYIVGSRDLKGKYVHGVKFARFCGRLIERKRPVYVNKDDRFYSTIRASIRQYCLISKDSTISFMNTTTDFPPIF